MVVNVGNVGKALYDIMGSRRRRLGNLGIFLVYLSLWGAVTSDDV